jgi:hypothetical protein
MIRVVEFNSLLLIAPDASLWRTAEIRTASMKPKLELELVISESRLSRY